MLFCEKCRYAYTITKNIKEGKNNNKIDESLDSLFEKFTKKEEITHVDLKRLKSVDILDDNRYDSMNKKDQKKIMSIIKAIDKNFFIEDEKDRESSSTDAYFICKFCRNHKPIGPGTIIYSKKYSTDTSSVSDDYTYIIHDYTLPRTHNYICKNTKCATHKDPSLKEAILTKNVSEQLVYVCTHCKTYWITSL